jgi:hypothetical protein
MIIAPDFGGPTIGTPIIEPFGSSVQSRILAMKNSPTLAKYQRTRRATREQGERAMKTWDQFLAEKEMNEGFLTRMFNQDLHTDFKKAMAKSPNVANEFHKLVKQFMTNNKFTKDQARAAAQEDIMKRLNMPLNIRPDVEQSPLGKSWGQEGDF